MAESVSPAQRKPETDEQITAAWMVVRKADAYRMIEKGELHAALGLGPVLPQEIETARAALDEELDRYMAAMGSNPA